MLQFILTCILTLLQFINTINLFDLIDVLVFVEKIVCDPVLP